MYQPRRISDALAFEPHAEAVAFRNAPRRAARTRIDMLRNRVAPTAVSVALLATAGSFAVNLKASEEPATAVPAPVRDVDALSRDTVRTALDEAPAEAAATEAQEGAVGAEAYVGGQWATAFGASAGSKYAQAAVEVRAQAAGDAAELGTLKSGEKVSVTDKVTNGFRQVAWNGKVGYVLESRLGDAAPAPAPKQTVAPKPAAPKPAAPKPAAKAAPATYTGSTTYSGRTVLGLKPKAMVVYNAVTARWSFNSIGGYRANSLSNHQYGGAIDFMLTPGAESAKGWAVANYVAANAAAFDIDHIIFEQKIWTPYKPYWRPMENRGSITANHYDHVHVSVKL